MKRVHLFALYGCQAIASVVIDGGLDIGIPGRTSTNVNFAGTFAILGVIETSQSSAALQSHPAAELTHPETSTSSTCSSVATSTLVDLGTLYETPDHQTPVSSPTMMTKFTYANASVRSTTAGPSETGLSGLSHLALYTDRPRLSLNTGTGRVSLGYSNCTISDHRLHSHVKCCESASSTSLLYNNATSPTRVGNATLSLPSMKGLSNSSAAYGPLVGGGVYQAPVDVFCLFISALVIGTFII